jgi:hypothetical protein
VALVAVSRSGLLRYVKDRAKLLRKSAHALDMEVIMPAHSSMHFYLNWAKERIDEMDAVLASFETKASEVQTTRRVPGDRQ